MTPYIENAKHSPEVDGSIPSSACSIVSGLKIISRMRHCDGYISRIPMSEVIVPPAELIVEVHVLLLKTIRSKF